MEDKVLPSSISQVEEFHTAFNCENKQTIITVKTDTDVKLVNLRIGLILEELTELICCFDEPVLLDAISLLSKSISTIRNAWNKIDDGVELVIDQREILDALCDLQYVLDGTKLSFGYGDIFDEAFAAVHKSNMSKLCIDHENAEVSVMHYDKLGIETFIEPTHLNKHTVRYIVKRKSDNKVLKSINYVPVFNDLQCIVDIKNNRTI